MPDPAPPPGPSTRVFLHHRELLFSVVYTMLGSVADTEDVLQETWLSWTQRKRELIDNPRGYLVRIAVNQALARQAAIRRRRETYVGPWLPEPLRTTTTDAAAEAVERAESVSMALLVVLETLSPLERAVFVLNEVFGYGHPEIAAILGRTPAAVRQLGHRARARVQARRPRFRAEPEVRREVTARFMAAASGADVHALLELLAPDVTLWTDGGGKVRRAALRPVHGPANVSRMILGFAARSPGSLRVRREWINGDPAALLLSGDVPVSLLVLDLTPDGERIRGIYAVANPDKLSHCATPTT